MYRTKSYTPLFNQKSFLNDLTLEGGVDHSFHVRILETIAFPKKEIIKLQDFDGVTELVFPEYSSSQPLYTNSSFIEEGTATKKEKLPSKKEILYRLKSFPRIPYLLGGAIPFPIDMECSLGHDVFANRHRKIFGIDCSGLLYYVTEGHVPRNTSEMMAMGNEVEDLKPLDLILFTGHVLIYLGEGEVIESREFDGVVVSEWSEREKALSKPYKFIRWYPQAFSKKSLLNDLNESLNLM